VPLQVISLQQEYREKIVSYVVDEVRRGRTPNPDVLCNERIKFGLFLDYIDPSFERVATGHYAQVEDGTQGRLLKIAPDVVKDQTYFLCRLSQQQLARCLFPIGHLTKQQVRQLAVEFDLPNKDRKDSQGVCFLGKFKFSDFLKHHLGEKEGDLVEYETNQKVGTHNGFWFYTIGQRQGIRLGQGPWYVVTKNIATNTVYISRSYYAPEKIRTSVLVKECHWFAPAIFTESDTRIKLRHGVQYHKGQITHISPTECLVTLEDNDQGIANGQFAVFYSNNYCMGSGIIAE
jgi:tRNA (5-methylaminomethyl-2-thiouridylate)-methyltransferase